MRDIRSFGTWRSTIRRSNVMAAGMIVAMLAEGNSTAGILQLYPYLDSEDVAQALSQAALRSEEREVELKPVKILIERNLSPSWVTVFQEEKWEA